MLLSSRISLSGLSALCQAIRVGHGAGLSIVDVFKQQAVRGPSEARGVLGRISRKLDEGESLEDVLQVEGSAFPPLFVAMVAVGEQTGHLPEIFKELERYYREQLSLRRQFMAKIAWPVFQLVAAIGVINLMIFILGQLTDEPKYAFDPLGFGVGSGGVIRFTLTMAVFFTGLFAAYYIVTRMLGKKAAVHRLLLSVPALGSCLQALALSRFALALRLTMDTSLTPARAVRRSLWAAGNGAYEACADSVASDVKRGEPVAESLGKTRVMPEDFISILSSAEETGQIPEVMAQQAQHYQEEASRKMSTLTMFATFAVWAFVALLLIWAIFRIAFKILGLYDSILENPLGV